MRLAIVRQHFDPGGAVERPSSARSRRCSSAMSRSRSYTRSWPPTRLQLIEPVICDPIHVGALWRDWGFARAACRADPPGQARRSSSRTSRCPAATSIAPATASTPSRLDERGGAARAGRARWRSRSRRATGICCTPSGACSRAPWLRAVICNSKMVRDEIRDRFGLPEAKLHVIYNPVDCDVFHPGLRAGRSAVLARHGIALDADVYLLVGAGCARRRASIPRSMRSPAVPAPAHLVVVGDGVQADALARACARRLGVAERITFAGAAESTCGHSTAPPTRSCCPSLYDPSPVAAQEAMACGLAVVTSTKSGAAELLREHDAGLVCAPDDVRRSRRADAARCGTPSSARALRERARARSLPLSPAAITLQLVLLYRDLLSGTAPGAAAS